MYTKWNVALVFCGLNPVGPNGFYLTTPHKAVAGTTEGAPGNKKTHITKSSSKKNCGPGTI